MSEVLVIYNYYEDCCGKKWKTVGFANGVVLLRRFLRYTIGPVSRNGENVIINNDGLFFAFRAVKTDVYERVKL